MRRVVIVIGGVRSKRAANMSFAEDLLPTLSNSFVSRPVQFFDHTGSRDILNSDAAVRLCRWCSIEQ